MSGPADSQSMLGRRTLVALVAALPLLGIANGALARTTTTPPATGSSATTRPSTVTADRAGSRDVVVRVRGGAGRVTVDVAGREIGRFATTAAWQQLRVPVVVRAGETVRVTPVAPDPGAATTPVEIAGLSLVPAASGFTVQGPAVLDPSGRPFTVRGLNRMGLESSPRGWYVNEGNASKMYGWGANAVRIQVSEAFWLPQTCHYDPGYPATLDREVAGVTKFGMVALIDLHWSVKDRACGVTPNQQKMADRLAITFWQQVAARYKDNPLVAFDLYNEPHDVTPQVWRDGGTVDGWSAAGMQQLYDAVRSTGARNLVFVSGLMWGLDLRHVERAPLDGYGIVYATHMYCDACGDKLFPGADGYALPVAASHPVVLTEFGGRDADGRWNRAVISWAESHGIGWMAYGWNAGRAEDYCILSSWDTAQPNRAGTVIRDALWAARGWHSPWGLWG